MQRSPIRSHSHVAVDPPRRVVLRGDRAWTFPALYCPEPTADADPYPLCAQDVTLLPQLEVTPQALNHPAAFSQDGPAAGLKHRRTPTIPSSALVRQQSNAPLGTWGRL